MLSQRPSRHSNIVLFNSIQSQLDVVGMRRCNEIQRTLHQTACEHGAISFGPVQTVWYCHKTGAEERTTYSGSPVKHSSTACGDQPWSCLNIRPYPCETRCVRSRRQAHHCVPAASVVRQHLLCPSHLCLISTRSVAAGPSVIAAHCTKAVQLC